MNTTPNNTESPPIKKTWSEEHNVFGALPEKIDLMDKQIKELQEQVKELSHLVHILWNNRYVGVPDDERYHD